MGCRTARTHFVSCAVEVERGFYCRSVVATGVELNRVRADASFVVTDCEGSIYSRVPRVGGYPNHSPATLRQNRPQD